MFHVDVDDRLYVFLDRIIVYLSVGPRRCRIGYGRVRVVVTDVGDTVCSVSVTQLHYREVVAAVVVDSLLRVALPSCMEKQREREKERERQIPFWPLEQ